MPSQAIATGRRGTERGRGGTASAVGAIVTATRDRIARGDVPMLVSPRGIEFSLLTRSPRALSDDHRPEAPSLWLALPMEGPRTLDDRDEDAPAQADESRPGDLRYGLTGQSCAIECPRGLAFLYVTIPGHLLPPGLLDPRGLRVGGLSGADGVHRVFSGMLRSIAGSLDELRAEQLRPIETALTEFVVASLRPAGSTRCAGSARAGAFQRLCESLEAQLGDGELSLRSFAAGERVSVRYVQKLFGEAGLGFSAQLRLRRLERCRGDLAQKAFEARSISEICFRWGFNDAAHFSRAFRAQFGTTPRAFRQSALRPRGADRSTDR